MRRDLIAAVSGIIILFLLLAAAFWAGKQTGLTAARADCHSQEAAQWEAAAKQSREAADQFKVTLLESQKRLDKQNARVEKETRSLQEFIRTTVKTQNLGEWYEADINAVERAALYGVPVPPGTDLPAAYPLQPRPDPAHTPAR